MFHAEQRLNFRIICRKKRDRPFRLEKPVSFYYWIKPVQKILQGRCSV